MVRVATCPACMQPVTVPTGLESECRVRCPICEAEYPLADLPLETEEADSEEMSGGLEIPSGEAEGDQTVLPPELIPVADFSEQSEQASPLSSEEEEAFLAEAALQEEEPLLAEQPLEEPQEVEGEPEEVSASIVFEGSEEVTAEIVTEEVSAEEVLGAMEGVERAESLEEVSEAEVSETEPAAAELAAESPLGEEESPAEAEPAEAVEEAPPLDLDPMVRGPFGAEAFPLSQLIVEATGEPIGPAAAALIVRQGLLRPISEEEAAEMASAEAPATEEASEGFDFGGFASAAEGAAPGPPIAARPRRRSEVNPLKEMIGIVVGGAMGLLIGYYLLNVFGGARFNFLEIYLPGVKHTYKHAPRWLPQWAKWGVEPAGSEESEGKEASSPEKKNNRSSAKPKPSQPESSGTPGEKQGGKEAAVPATSSSKGQGDQPPSAAESSASQPPGAKPSKPPKGKPSVPADKPAFALEVTGAPSYSADDLGQAHREVLEVFGCKQCNSTGQQTKTVTEVQQVDGQPKEVSKQVSVPCEACKGQPPKAITEESFARFCRLAEVLSFVRGPEDKNFLQDRRFAARTLLERAAEEPGNAETIGAQAASVWGDAGRLSMGILAAGKLGHMEPSGRWQQYELQFTGADRKAPLLLRSEPPAGEGDTVLVLGCIVEDPAANLRGYSGSQDAVLVGVLVVKVP